MTFQTRTVPVTRTTAARDSSGPGPGSLGPPCRGTVTRAGRLTGTETITIRLSVSLARWGQRCGNKYSGFCSGWHGAYLTKFFLPPDLNVTFKSFLYLPVSICLCNMSEIAHDDFQEAFGFEMKEMVTEDKLQDMIGVFMTGVFGGDTEGNWTETKETIEHAVKRNYSASPTTTTVRDVAKHFFDAYTSLSPETGAYIKAVETKKEDKTELNIISHLLNFGKAVFNRNVENDADKDVENAAENNAKQVKRLSEEGTIWHAVSAFGSPAGKKSWRTVKVVNTLLSQDKGKPFVAPWMTGKDRGIFGETPLHIALLFNVPGVDYTQFFQELWTLCPKLRTLCYAEPLYHGENALHIAIIKKAGLDVIKTMVESEGPELLTMQADGMFFKEAALSEGAVNNLGDFPLCFAACTLQSDVFDYLIEQKADPRVTTQEGNNLLHLMVLNAFNRTDGAEEPSDKDSDAEKKPVANVEKAFTEMYDKLLKCLEKDVLEELRNQANNDGYTPLTLAAARGSLAFFDHVFEKEVSLCPAPPDPCTKKAPAPCTDQPLLPRTPSI